MSRDVVAEESRLLHALYVERCDGAPLGYGRSSGMLSTNPKLHAE